MTDDLKKVSLNIYANEVRPFAVKAVTDLMLALDVEFNVQVGTPIDFEEEDETVLLENKGEIISGEIEFTANEYDQPEVVPYDRAEFQRELAALLNKYSVDAATNTADYVLADYIFGAIAAFSAGVERRDESRGTHFVIDNE